MPAPFLDTLRRRLSAPLPGLGAQLRMAPVPRMWPDPGAVLRPAAALLVIYPHEDLRDPIEGTGEPVDRSLEQWRLPLTVRSVSLRQHTGQVSLPGGRLDRHESIEQAALREAHEEIGVVPADVEILGRLTPLPIAISGHLLHPVVGVMAARPSFELATDEVDRLIEVPLARLLLPDAVAWEERVRSLPATGVMNVPFFELEGARVWGATAMVLAEFIALLDEIEG